MGRAMHSRHRRGIILSALAALLVLPVVADAKRPQG